MSLRNKFFSILAVAIGIVGFSTFTLARTVRVRRPLLKKAKGIPGAKAAVGTMIKVLTVVMDAAAT
jgi:hypothetical protein